MKKKKVSLCTCILLCVICIISSAVITASPTTKQIVAYLNYGLNIEVDGEIKQMTDAGGNRVYPITFDGTTYVPVRGLGQLMGANIGWNNDTNTVVVKTKISDKSLITGNELNTEYSNILESSQRTLAISDNVYTFDNGLYCKSVLNEDIKYTNYIGLSVPIGTTGINFNAYSEHSSSINVFNQQGKLLKTFYINPNVLTDCSFEVDSTKNTEIYIVTVCQTENVSSSSVNIYNVYGR